MKEIGYEEACEIYGSFESWDLGSAIDLMRGNVPHSLHSDKGVDEGSTPKRKLLIEFLYSSLGVSIPRVGREWENIERNRVKPIDAIDWARRLDMKVSDDLVRKVEKSDAYERLSGATTAKEFHKQMELVADEYPAYIGQAIREFNPNQMRKHRSRGIAAYLWAENPALTKSEMANHPAIIEFGCEGQAPVESTMLKWFQGITPNKGGRPQNKPST